MNQSRLGSLIETLTNVAIGFGISMVSNMIILPHFGYDVTWGQSFHMGVYFTIISVARGYLLRRYFNHRLHLAVKQLVGG